MRVKTKIKVGQQCQALRRLVDVRSCWLPFDILFFRPAGSIGGNSRRATLNRTCRRRSIAHSGRPGHWCNRLHTRTLRLHIDNGRHCGRCCRTRCTDCTWLGRRSHRRCRTLRLTRLGRWDRIIRRRVCGCIGCCYRGCCRRSRRYVSECFYRSLGIGRLCALVWLDGRASTAAKLLEHGYRLDRIEKRGLGRV